MFNVSYTKPPVLAGFFLGFFNAQIALQISSGGCLLISMFVLVQDVAQLSSSECPVMTHHSLNMLCSNLHSTLEFFLKHFF